MNVRDILSWVETFAPFEYAEPWDNVGLQVGNSKARVQRVLFALDPSSSTIREAEKLGCECLIVHHPLFLEGIRSFSVDEYPQSLIFELIRRDINLVVVHTNLDVSTKGGNYRISKLLDLSEVRPLDVNPRFFSDSRYAGMGVVGQLGSPCSITELSKKLGNLLKIDKVNLIGKPNRLVKTVAVCTGSGGSLLKKAIYRGADCFITGEVKHHDALWANEVNLSVIALGHFASEKFMMEELALDFRRWAITVNNAVEVFWFDQEKDYVESFVVEGL